MNAPEVGELVGAVIGAAVVVVGKALIAKGDKDLGGDYLTRAEADARYATKEELNGATRRLENGGRP